MTRTCDCTTRGRIDCGGRCVRGTACVSGLPVTRRELAQREAGLCGVGMATCGARSQQVGKQGWECTNTTDSLESCGGCTIGYNGAKPDQGAADCSLIPGVNTVGCNNGACKVESCNAGYRVANNGSTCETMIYPVAGSA